MKILILCLALWASVCACTPRAPFSVDFPFDGGDTDTGTDTDTDSDTDSDTDTGTDTDTDTDTDTGEEFPATCGEYLIANPGSVDGEYTLYVGNDVDKPWDAYCHNMAGTPVEYLSLINTGGAYNYGEYIDVGCVVVTHYTRVRLNPVTIIVDTADQLFSSSTGNCMHGTISVTSISYGAAMRCGAALATGNADLVGTDFKIIDPYCFTNTGPGWFANFSAGDQVVDFSADGACGWTQPCPSSYNPMNAGGGEYLELEYIN